VHIPLSTTPELLAKYEAKKPMPGYPSRPEYAGLLEELDQSVGRIAGAVDRLGLGERTLVLFVSDNGGLETQQNGVVVTSNHPLREEKGTLYEGGIRVPAVARWTGRNRLLAGDPSLPPHTHQSYHKGRPRESHDPGIKPWVAMEDVLTERTGKFQVVSNYGTGGDPKARGIRRSDEPSATVTSKITRNVVVSPSGEPSNRLTPVRWASTSRCIASARVSPPVTAAVTLPAPSSSGRRMTGSSHSGGAETKIPSIQ
jgi:hypothetical protein